MTAWNGLWARPHSASAEFVGYHIWLQHTLGRLVENATRTAPRRPGRRIKQMGPGVQGVRMVCGETAHLITRRRAHVEVVRGRLRFYNKYPH